MSHKGNVQLIFIVVAPPDQVAEGDRIFEHHAAWMAETHHREGDKALLVYDVSRVAELSNPLDASSAPTGNTCFILMEVYESEAGVADHFQQAGDSWTEFSNFQNWLGSCQATIVTSAPIVHALW
jgi:hypothetical protein